MKNHYDSIVMKKFSLYYLSLNSLSKNYKMSKVCCDMLYKQQFYWILTYCVRLYYFSIVVIQRRNKSLNIPNFYYY